MPIPGRLDNVSYVLHRPDPAHDHEARLMPEPVEQQTPPVDASPEPAAPPPAHVKAARYLWTQWIKPMGLILLAVFAFKSSILDWNDVPTGSMEPSVWVGDRIAVNKLAFDLKIPFTLKRIAYWGQPQRGDVVVFYSPQNGIRLVKRVVGLPGDRIEVRKNVLLINGQELTYTPANVPASGLDLLARDPSAHYEAGDAPPAPVRWTAIESLIGHPHPIQLVLNQSSPKSNFGPIEVPPDHYFVMGDNRDVSYDSRYFGFVPRKNIVGRAFTIALSLGNYYVPRMDRFFLPLP